MMRGLLYRSHTILVFGSIATVCLLASVLTYAADPGGSGNSPERLQSSELPPLSTARDAGRSKSALLTSTVRKAAPESTAERKANLADFEKHVKPALTLACVKCHGAELAERQIRIDTLNPDLLQGGDVKRWLEVRDVISNGEMPPEDAEQKLADADLRRIIEWLNQEIQWASTVRRGEESYSSFRRMARYEYNYALQDLLGLPYDFADNLPPETASEDGFQNNSELLQISTMQFETFREIGLKALKRATVIGERPEPVTYIISMQDEMTKAATDPSKLFDKVDETNQSKRNRPHLFNRETGQGLPYAEGKFLPTTDAVAGQTPAVSPIVLALPRSTEVKLDLDRFLPDEGIMHVRIRAGRTTMDPEEFASLRLIFSAHTSNNANFSQIVSQHDIPVTASADNPEFIHFDIPLGDIQRNPFRKLETTFPRRDEFLHIHNVSNARNQNEPLHVLIDSIEISAPYYEQWPPKTHTDIFFDSPHRSNEELYGREVLERFLRRVWRRPVTSAEVDQFMGLFAEYRTQFTTFEEAMIEVLATTLATPEFLYLTQKSAADDATGPEMISDVELASRLSFFLWSSIPDEPLMQLAEQGTLHETDVLTAQVSRMLADPRSQRFSQNFVQQWLGLDGLQSITHVTDSSLLEAMEEEPIAFFAEVLERNGSLFDFIHSDYVVVNERLARHYGIPGVYGPHFRAVPVEARQNRGGVLTHAAVLTMNSDGQDSHVLKRGVWLLERMLQDPPPPPPPNVPQVDLTDPNILKMTLKERLINHRSKPACISCHSKIDPWGIAFENYDALGLYRTTIKNTPVDAQAELFNKQELAGMDGLKRYLLADRQDQFVRAMVQKMTSYALGRSLSFSDHADIDSLAVQCRQEGDRLGALVRLIVTSDIFRSK
ncbi:DUF1592 domain-containing protein [bacterium]|nr:DUF1592 domain-containing protein [bacterium]